MLKHMLDTNIVIYKIKNKPKEVRRLFNVHNGQMCICSVTLMELIYSAERSENLARNLKDIEGFSARLEVLPYDDAAAIHTGQIRAELM